MLFYILLSTVNLYSQKAESDDRQHFAANVVHCCLLFLVARIQTILVVSDFWVVHTPVPTTAVPTIRPN